MRSWRWRSERRGAQSSRPVMPKCMSTSASPAGKISHLPWRIGSPKRRPSTAARFPPRNSVASITSTCSIRRPAALRASRRKPSTSGSSGTQWMGLAACVAPDSSKTQKSCPITGTETL
jgi:hypothetical protein